jgi:hypothetical protein
VSGGADGSAAQRLARTKKTTASQASGVQSLRGIARALTARGVKTARGGQWNAVQVGDIINRSPE